MGSSPAVSGSFNEFRTLFTDRAFLYDNPQDFMAGVDAVLTALATVGLPVTDPGRRDWPKAQRLAP